VRGPKPTPIELSEPQQAVLEKIIRRQTSTQQLVRRAKIILSVGAGNNNQEIARSLDIHRETVVTWRRRWLEVIPQLTGAELSGVSENELLLMIEQVLTDEVRSGAPVKYTGTQVASIIAIVCSDPQSASIPLSHWSASAIKEVAIAHGIVDKISERTIQRFLKRSRFETASQSVLAQQLCHG
jgi:transposase